MKSTFDLIIADLLHTEGGFAHRSRKADPGGPTHYGITQGTLSAWRERKVSVEEVQALNQSEAVEIYRAQYWDAVRGDRLPLGLDYALFDFGVNSGPARAVKTLQAILGVGVDGVIGLKTLAAIKQRPVVYLVNELSARRLAFMKRLRNWPYNKNGWSRRVRDVQEKSLKLMEDRGKQKQTVPVLDGFDRGQGAKALGQETGVINALMTPEGLSKAAAAVSGFAGMLAGSGPVQWAFALSLLIGVGVGAICWCREHETPDE
ncbi:glycoside hydrolase family 108 protein [Pseudovibrio denitrificans]|uniref:glycoside hydrolase family 108 protein n=1 Tax=Pseudovibrio denitrificans TaxID=258256 RepID=UPI000AD64E17|nr:glycoside hydrolase family 108 protein [Pseudovibrio denitrificans]